MTRASRLPGPPSPASSASIVRARRSVWTPLRAESRTFRVVEDHQVGALGADQHAADRRVEPAGGDDGPAAQRQLAGPQPRIPVVRHSDGGQHDVILRPLQERPLAVGRLGGSPLGGSVQGQDRVADFGVQNTSGK